MYPPRNPQISIFEDEPQWKFWLRIAVILIIPILSAIPAIIMGGR